MNGFDREVRFDILEHIGVLTTHSTGWSKEVNLISWNGGQPKYDLRDWDPTHSFMSRGVTLTEGEMRKLIECMYVRRKTPLQDRLATAEKQHKQQLPEEEKGRGDINR